MAQVKATLSGHVAVVTGCAKGVAQAIAIALAKRGAVVAGHYYKSKMAADETREELKALSPTSDMFKANLRNHDEVRQMIVKIVHDYGRIDVLVNSVGNFIYKPFDEVSVDEFNDVIETNLTSTFVCSRLVLPVMKEQGGGKIINFGCVGADRLVIRGLTTPYYIAKTGVVMLTKIMAQTYAPFGITVNSISPGVLETSIAKPEMPSGRYAQFDDIINAIDFLLLPTSGYVNGANIEVAGGWTP